MSFRFRECILATLLLRAVSAPCLQSTDPVAEARSLIAANKIAESEAVLQAYLQSSPSSAEAHFLLGYDYFRDRKPKESLAEFTAGAKFKRPPASDLKVVASDYILLGDYGDADTWFSEVVSETPNDANVWYLLGRTKYNESEAAAAVPMFEHALSLRPKDVEAENNLGLCWKELNKSDAAKTAFQTAIDWEGDPPTDAQPFLNLGTLLADQSDFNAALPYITKAVQLAPDNPKVREELGDVYGGQGDFSKAQAEYERAIALAPDVSALHFKLGQMLRKEGLRDRAQKEFEICAKLNGTQSSKKTPNTLSLGRPDFQ
jgi:tetratricopeptide (TPR) repeat protein